MAHATCHFMDALLDTRLSIATEALRRIAEPYSIEAEMTANPANVRLAERLRHKTGVEQPLQRRACRPQLRHEHHERSRHSMRAPIRTT